MDYDFCGWATRANVKCADGRVIMPNAFKDEDGMTVPLVYNHRHNSIDDVLGHALLENRPEGVFAYCKFNDTEQGQTGKKCVLHGDVDSLSIYANQLKQDGPNVIHGHIRELSLVLAGANPAAKIQNVFPDIEHGEAEDEESAYIYTGGSLEMSRNNEDTTIQHAEPETKKPETKGEEKSDDSETVEDVFNTLSEKQKKVVYFMIGQALESAGAGAGQGGEEMKHNIFDTDEYQKDNVLTHADGMSIVSLAKQRSVGTLQNAFKIYAEEHFEMDSDELAHGFEDIDFLFPEYKDVKPGAPEIIRNDDTWVSFVIDKTHKSPISRIRTKQTDIRDIDPLAYGYNDRTAKKKLSSDAKFLHRTTDPQTIYRRDQLHRDDIIDITDFDIVEYQYGIMRENLKEMLALAIMIGDGRDEADPDKIHQEHIRSIWNDVELYTIHYSVQVDGDYTQEIQDIISLGGDVTDYTPNYQYTEAIIAAALLSREKFKGTGTPDFYCDPHIVNLMLLTRDLNGRRMYDSKSDLAKALNVGQIHTVEQFANKKRYGSLETEDADKEYTLLGIFVNLADYQLGCTKGGEITKFQQFDIDFNTEKMLLETRLSGALTRIKSAVALEICNTVNSEPGTGN